MAICILVVSVTSGCAGWFNRSRHVDPVILEQVRGIGAVRGERVLSSDIDGTMEITNVFVIDVEGESPSGALDKAIDALTARKWSIMIEKRPIRVQMKSLNRDTVHLTVAPFDKIYLETAPELRGMIDGSDPGAKNFVIVDVYDTA
ncbi:hypothetical protein [Nonomuraea coxensis]|uniref:hypothetical protein n=1 Tax=Nonomuraea coxensis TaxID=404386 RepID=UPI0012FA18F4|nr:hypothetical protein [Nonomuraea coxensis]